MEEIIKKNVINKIEKLLDKVKYGEIKIKLGETYNCIDIKVEEVHRLYKNKEQLKQLENKFHKG